MLFYFQLAQMLLDKTNTETGFRRTNKIILIFPPHSLRISFPGVLVTSLQAVCWNHTAISIRRYTGFCLRELNWNKQAGLSFQSIQLKEKQNNHIFFIPPNFTILSKQNCCVLLWMPLLLKIQHKWNKDDIKKHQTKTSTANGILCSQLFKVWVFFSPSPPTWQNLPANLVLRSEWKSPMIWLSEEIVLIFPQSHPNYILFIIFFSLYYTAYYLFIQISISLLFS